MVYFKNAYNYSNYELQSNKKSVQKLSFTDLLKILYIQKLK